MKMAIFVKLRPAVEKALVTLTKINAEHASHLSNVSAALITLLERVTVKSVQAVSMMFLELGLILSARSDLAVTAPQNMATVKVRIS